LHALMLPAAVVSGAILAGARSGAIRSVDPGLMVLASFLAGGAAAGATHLGRASIRPPLKLLLVPAAPLSLLEDAGAVALTASALWAPVAVPLLLALLVAFGGLLAVVALAVRRVIGRALATSTRRRREPIPPAA
ncbi:MAG: DUF4126 family protein, partial [Thermomicrobiaceae bacterium]|nr:DUF4126 family protein [Thermomicrobiaceae bacterium]